VNPAASMMSVESPERARHMVIVFASPILSPKGPPTSAPAPYMKDEIVVTMPISVFVVKPKLVIIMDSKVGAMIKSE
jgi:hypothetical protein